MVGDNLEWEVVSPQRLGIHAIWHDGYGVGLPADSPIRPDRIAGCRNCCCSRALALAFGSSPKTRPPQPDPTDPRCSPDAYEARARRPGAPASRMAAISLGCACLLFRDFRHLADFLGRKFLSGIARGASCWAASSVGA
jgi:hypothetical protein